MRSTFQSCRAQFLILTLLVGSWTTHGIAQDKAQITVLAPKPSDGECLIGPDDTLEMVLHLPANPSSEAPLESAKPTIQTWLVEKGNPFPDLQSPAHGLIQCWPSPIQPGAWLIHLRGLKAPTDTATRESKWDLCLRWGIPGGDQAPARSGQVRLEQSILFGSNDPDVVLLLDGSASMGLNDPQRMRVEAARAFVTMGLRSGGIGRVAVIQFSSRVRVLLPLTSVKGLEAFEAVLASLNENGMTDIDGSLREAIKTLQGASKSRRNAIVLLTDGKQEPGNYNDAHHIARDAGVPIHSVALGKSADRDLLKRIADETGGTFSEANHGQDLIRLYGAIAGRIVGGRVITEKTFQGAETETPFPVDGTCRSLAISVESDAEGELVLKDPRGIASGSGTSSQPVQYRQAPLTGNWAGLWKPSREAINAQARLSIRAHTPLYPLFFRDTPPATQEERSAPVSFDLDDPRIALSLSEATRLVQAREVLVMLTLPGQENPLSATLFDDGQHGDSQADDGIFAGDLPEILGSTPNLLGQQGPLVAVIKGQRNGAEPFRREIHTSWLAQRTGIRKLQTSGPLDLGTHWAGEIARGKVAVRVRGRGGLLSMAAEGPEAEAQTPAPSRSSIDLWRHLQIEAGKIDLRPRQNQSVEVSVAIPEATASGAYRGTIRIQLAQTSANDVHDPGRQASIPWKITVQQPVLTMEPRELNLGLLHPGASVTRTIKLKTGGGVLTLLPPGFNGPERHPDEAPLLNAVLNPHHDILPTLRLTSRHDRSMQIHDTFQSIALTFSVAPDATEDLVQNSIIFRDGDRAVAARLPIRAQIAPQWIELKDNLDLGLLEPGDKLERNIRWAWKEATPWAIRSAVAMDHPDHAHLAWEPDANGLGGRLQLRLPDTAKDGPVGGWLKLDASPALLMRRWTAETVKPHLSLDPPALDFGTIFPGQSAEKKLQFSFIGARPIEITTSIEASPSKPRFPDRVLPESSFQIPNAPRTLKPGGQASIIARLKIPIEAEDGLYQTRIQIDERLGRRIVPVSFRIVYPLPGPAFHVSPPSILLTGKDQQPSEITTVYVTSHLDDDLTLDAQIVPISDDQQESPGVVFNLEDAPPTHQIPLLLPGRGEAKLHIRALPHASHGSEFQVVIQGGQERQVVQIGVEQIYSQAAVSKMSRPDANSMADWLGWLLLLFLLLLVLLVRALVRKKWVRYGFYAVALHLVLMLLTVPPAEIVGSLPVAIQITLLESQENLGAQLSPEQVRRLKELQTGMQDLATVAEKKPEDPARLAALAGSAAADLPAPNHAAGQSGSPSAPARLTRAEAHEMLAAEAPPRLERDIHEPELDDALPMEPLPHQETPAQEKPQKTAEAPQPAESELAIVPTMTRPRLDEPERKHEREEPLPTQHEVRLEQKVQQPVQTVVEPATEQTEIAQRPSRELASEEDIPLTADSIVMPTAEATETAQKTKTASEESRTEPARFAPSDTVREAAELPAATGQNSMATAAPQAQATLSEATVAGATTAMNMEVSGKGDTSVGATRRPQGTNSGIDSDSPLDSGALPVTASGSGTGTSKSMQDASGQGPAHARGGSSIGIGHLFGKDGSKGTGGLGGTGTSGRLSGGAQPSKSSGGAGLGKLASYGNLDGAGRGKDLAEGSGRGQRGLGKGMLNDAPLEAGGLGTGTREGEGSKDHQGPGKFTGRNLPAGGGMGLAMAGAGKGSSALGELEGGRGGGHSLHAPGGQSRMLGGPSAAMLEHHEKGSTPKAGQGQSERGERPQWGPADRNQLKIRLGLAIHSGDWDSSPTALFNLSTAFAERCGLPNVDIQISKVKLTDEGGLKACQMILITSNDPILFTAAEREGLRRYALGGGFAWINDSSASGDERFDRGIRKDLQLAFPQDQLQRLPSQHSVLGSAYNLSQGYKGYKIPPGDKYREEYLEGITVVSNGGAKRTPIIYSRNDYADGMEIDASQISGRRSLTDLTGQEMLEGSLRMGINMLAYALGSKAPKLPPPPEGIAEFEKIYRYKGPKLAAFDDFEQPLNAEGKPVWSAEDWGNPAVIGKAQTREEGRLLKIDVRGDPTNKQTKAAVSRLVDLNLTDAKSIVLDLHSSLSHGFNVALLLQTKPDWDGYESRPVFVRPGWNRDLRFPLNMDDFKSNKNEWKAFAVPFNPRSNVARLALLLYNHDSDGEILLDCIRIEK